MPVPFSASSAYTRRSFLHVYTTPCLTMRVPGTSLPVANFQRALTTSAFRVHSRRSVEPKSMWPPGWAARVLTARRLGLDVSPSRLLGRPRPGTLSFLVTEGGQPFLAAWNVPKRQNRCLAPAARGAGSI